MIRRTNDCCCVDCLLRTLHLVIFTWSLGGPFPFSFSYLYLLTHPFTIDQFLFPGFYFYFYFQREYDIDFMGGDIQHLFFFLNNLRLIKKIFDFFWKTLFVFIITLFLILSKNNIWNSYIYIYIYVNINIT